MKSIPKQRNIYVLPGGGCRPPGGEPCLSSPVAETIFKKRLFFFAGAHIKKIILFYRKSTNSIPKQRNIYVLPGGAVAPPGGNPA